MTLAVAALAWDFAGGKTTFSGGWVGLGAAGLALGLSAVSKDAGLTEAWRLDDVDGF